MIEELFAEDKTEIGVRVLVTKTEVRRHPGNAVEEAARIAQCYLEDRMAERAWIVKRARIDLMVDEDIDNRCYVVRLAAAKDWYPDV